VIGFWRVKHWEMSIRASANRGPITAEDINRDIAIRRNIEHVFGLGLGGQDEREGEARETSGRHEATSGEDVRHSNPISDQQLLHEARLTRDLRAAGLL
jgi:hypothetical protein